MVSGGSPGRKCMPATIVSQEMTISRLSGGLSTAASSRKARAAASSASGAKYRAISSNSARCPPSTRPAPLVIARPFGGEFLRAGFSRDPIEDAVDDFGLVLGEEGVRDVDKFRDGHPRGHIAPLQDLIGAGAKNGAQDGIDAGQPPALGKLLVDQRIDLELLAHHAIDEVAEEGGFGVGILATLDLLAEPMRLELGNHLVEVNAGHVHLIERLHGGQPCGASG